MIFFQIETAEAVRVRDIRQAMFDYEPKIVHFAGHGHGEKGLVFEDETGQMKFVRAEALAGLFSLFANRLDCVLLNACYSEVQAKEISRHINSVIGMSQAIGDKAAIEFAVGFYMALGAGETVESCYKHGCSEINMQGIPEHLTPKLLTKVSQPPLLTTNPYVERAPTKKNCYQNVLQPFGIDEKVQADSLQESCNQIMLINTHMNTPDQLLLSNEFKSFLENTEIKFTHRNRENVSMNDLFVFPDLKIIKDSLKDFSSSISSESLWNYAHRILVLGGEQSGKTTLAKRLFLDAFSHGFSPLLIQGSNIGQGQSKLEDQIKLIARETYNITQEEFLKRENLVCIIDDISANKLNTKTKKKLISDINNTFSNSIIIAEESFRFVTLIFQSLTIIKKRKFFLLVTFFVLN